LRLRRGIFLAGGNALAPSLVRLTPLIDIARSAFPERALYGFVDLFSGERHPLSDWRRLAAMGLKRIYLGMETGLDELLRLVNKPGSAAELTTFISELKTAGIAVGLIMMVGLGGLEFRASHAQASLELLAHLPLDDEDLVYLSPFIEQPGSAYEQERLKAALTAMSDEEIERELQRLARQIRSLGLRASRYDIREFIY
jgi:radical SAM superfamily enzyme YgiQ (UPF0313 family)